MPIETEHGWLLINHGYNEDYVYTFGVCPVDLDDLTRVLWHPTSAIFWPEELWELRGDVPNVVFSMPIPWWTARSMSTTAAVITSSGWRCANWMA